MSGKQACLTAERLRGLLHYDAATGVFTWVAVESVYSRVKVGDVAGTTNTAGYTQIGIGGRLYYAHRLAWLYVHGVWPERQIDHRFGVKGDNRLSELRHATHGQNKENIRRPNKNNKCGLLGVSPADGRWRADITANGKGSYLGVFDTPELAHAAHLEAKVRLHPFQTLADVDAR